MPHMMSTSFTTPLGFMLGVHHTLSSCDAIKAILDEPMKGIKLNFYAVSQLYFDSKMKKKVNMNVVEIHPLR
jgi:hypothetical protein